MTRALRAAYWLSPIAFCVALYWLGLRIWFEQDDFAWLNLRNRVTDFHSFLWAMFAPLAQGTVRPWSERGFFMAFSYLFGLRALPYRVFVFLNQFLNIALVMLIARKLTRSELAGFLAALFWISNVALIIPMSWNSSYNEVQCASFLLLSFYLFIWYTETAERKFYWMQWVTFVLGFGALEINVVYPAIAALYALLLARRYFRSTLPMFAISVAFVVIDRLASTQKGNFYYDMDFHPSALMATFWQYWKILLGIPAEGQGWSPDLVQPARILLTVAIVVFALWQTWKRRWLPLFFIGWFFIVLGPLLPLHNHVTDYYLTIPAIGMALLAAYASSIAWKRGWAASVIAAVLALLYFIPSVNRVRAGMLSSFDRADRVRALIQSVAYAKHIHPGKMVLLKDVDDELFWSGVYDSPFRIFGWSDVFLAPDSRPLVHEDPHLNPVDGYFLPESAARRVVDDDAAVVYAVEGRKLRNITKPYRILVDGQPPPPLARSIDVGLSLFREQVGEGWYGLEDGFRWSGKHAVVYLPGPALAGQRLYLHGFATDSQMKLGPLRVDLTIDCRALPMQVIAGPGFRVPLELRSSARFSWPSEEIEVAFTVDRTIRPPGEVRNLGLAFGQFTIK